MADQPHSDIETLEKIAEAGDTNLDLADAALSLAALDRPGVPIERYRDILSRLGDEIIDAHRSTGDPVQEILYRRHNFVGDERTYDDLQNFNLMRVIDRKKGLPVTLGILFIAFARHLGWSAQGLNFPGHFLVRIDSQEGRQVVDPFDSGKRLETPDLRRLYEYHTPQPANGPAPLPPAAYEEVSDRLVLIRLQNNIFVRLVGQERLDEAKTVLRRIQCMAPGDMSMTRESGLLHARMGHLDRAAEDLQDYLEFGQGSDEECHEVAVILQQIRNLMH